MNLPFALAALAAVLCFFLLKDAWTFTSARYSKLPDRYPVHFGLSGKADGWWKKTHATAFLMSYVGIATAGMSLSVTFIVLMTGGMDDAPSACAFLPLSVVLAWTFQRIQVGGVRYALGELQCIWPMLTGPLIATLIVSAAPPLAIWFYYTRVARPSPVDLIPCAGITKNGEPVDPTETFASSDERLCAVSHWKNLNGPTVRSRWTDPNGREAFVFDWKSPGAQFRSRRKVWSCVNRTPKYEGGFPVGEWTVRAGILGSPEEEFEERIVRVNP